MSIAVLKRKTQTKYNNMSVNNDTFSLNGTMRNQGYVGQTSLSRTIVRPLRNGTALRGHGGNNRTGRETVLKQSDIFSLEDNSVCLLYTSPSPRDLSTSRMPSSA